MGIGTKTLILPATGSESGSIRAGRAVSRGSKAPTRHTRLSAIARRLRARSSAYGVWDAQQWRASPPTVASHRQCRASGVWDPSPGSVATNFALAVEIDRRQVRR